jgi:COP9 signalosome complex subunit 1
MQADKMDAAPTAANAGPTPSPFSYKDFDLEGYLSNYSGHTKIFRAIFIAERSKDLELEATRIALEEIKKTHNTALYREVVDKAIEKHGGLFTKDQAWIDSVEKKAQQQNDRLEQELNGYRTNLIKESIRVRCLPASSPPIFILILFSVKMGHNDLGDFHYDRGDLQSALKCYVRTRDYCTTSKHNISMCLNVIKVSIEMGNFAHVVNYVNKAEQEPEVRDASCDPVVVAKLKVCAGLAHLDTRKYKLAARKFLETTFDLGNHFNEVRLRCSRCRLCLKLECLTCSLCHGLQIISPQDVAIFGGLCALAMFDRAELKSKVRRSLILLFSAPRLLPTHPSFVCAPNSHQVLDNTAFKNFLELVPQVRELIADFYNSRYASCLNYLQQLRVCRLPLPLGWPLSPG